MHPKFKQADELSRIAIDAAIEVHRILGPGLIESVYERCLLHELHLRNVNAIQQLQVPINYKGLKFEEPLKLDVLVEECLILELKATAEVLPVHQAQLLSYMILLDVPLGLLINFHKVHLVEGVYRMVLPGAEGVAFATETDD
jgi:GxxExxY protein